MGKGSTQYASRYSRDMNVKRPHLPNGGLHFPHTAHGLIQFDPPSTFAACYTVASGAPWIRVRPTRGSS